jgi:hypothetical protein
MQHYVIKFVSYLRQVAGFLRVLSSTNTTDRHEITEILLAVVTSTINQQTQYKIIIFHGQKEYVIQCKPVGV